MGFQLIRMDASEPANIPLKVGTHYIGRGTLLNCKDLRISRKHGAITVTETTVELTSLHQNQCFYISLLTKKIMPLAEGYSVSLANNCHFGLLRNSYWYELVYCNDDNPYYTTPNATEQVIKFTDKVEGTQFKHENKQAELNSCATSATSHFMNALRQPHTFKTEYNDDEDSDTATLDLEFDETLKGRTGGPEPQILRLEDPNTIITPTNNTVCFGKRIYRLISYHDGYHTKKLKTEPESPKKARNPEDLTTKEPNAQQHCPRVPDSSMDTQSTMDVKSEPKDANTAAESAHAKNTLDSAKPGSSNDQPSCSGDAGPPAPRAPRERCLYGAACYRKNPQHKIQFSHPSDADYGTGAKGQCPYRAGCRRTDPRHWATHEHPPGTVAQPVQPLRLPHQGMRVVQRRGQIFYINARAVHFHDDYYEVDGDSVDYEF